MFEPAFSDPPPFFTVPISSPDRTEPWGKLHMLRGFSFSWKGACDQHRAKKHCPDRGQGSYCQKRMKTPPTSFNQCSAEVTRLL
ncbi:unnamed protein product [Staurois parvus]|uniref:Uncharacterized protein n=1 Tax=Staurois parvus TaxID=386267 RepID=A0ABN9C1J3_9NEOB|nr:unnamed protein product [Staurois parvus]